MNVNEDLRNYVENKIYPLYEDNFIGDEKSRIDYVTERSIKIVNENNLDIDDNILYTVIAYHDIRKNNNETTHELDSADIMFNDEYLKTIFTDEQRITIKEAIEDQRSYLEGDPRNIYGKILSSASRNSSVEQTLKRSYKYGKKKNPDYTDDQIFEGAYEALLNKFGENGYAKFYFKDSVYEQFLQDIRELLKDKSNFINTQKEFINKLKKEGKLN